MNQTPQPPPGSFPPDRPPEYPPQGFGERPQPRSVPVNMPSVTPVVTYTLLAITVLVYLAQMATNAGINWLV